ncbi:glycoside hydrolase family 9 protein [Macrolepiota fuliginosa MF-IS2]|uniref:cellulase n=1 Tax=Macrolepiota fuliginosa MF-IS2 TaxID=1400762 RepID=A0A9P5XLA7_9AGAR|nr:glycoside hydrolase family 9 protein [Macrolepiota fuliginosa MF-IS2]
MHVSVIVVLLLNLVLPCLSQLSLPNPPSLPPNASSGAVPSLGGYPNRQWASLLGNLLYFYEAQRSGNLPTSNRVPWRNSSALDDGKDAGVDLSGGYYDAGDYIKATFPLSFTLMSICWGATDFGRGYDLANQTAYLDDMLRWGLDWLIKAHPNDDTLYVLVGDPDVDNDYWGGDQNIPTPRASFQINATKPGTDVAAGAAAAFAACSNLYRNKGFNNTFSGPATLANASYADVLLTHAKSLYSFAVNATGGRKIYQKSVPVIASSYGSSDYGDELAIAALLLSWATDSQDFHDQAAAHWTKYNLNEQDGVFNWDSKAPGVPILFTQVLQSSSSISGNLSEWQSIAEGYLDKIVGRRSPGRMTKDGLLYYNGDSDDASLNPALNAAMLLTRYAPYASSNDKRVAYLKFAQSQVDYTLGNNSMSAPYVVGVNPNSPSNPHSAAASGGNDASTIDTNPVNTAYVLYGAVIGGPDANDKFFDIRSDWPQTEVGLDYNAPLLALAAYNTMQTTVDPFYTSLKAGAYVKPAGFPCDAVFSQGCPSPKLSPGARVAMAIGITIVGLILIGLVAYWYYLGQKHKRNTF